VAVLAASLAAPSPIWFELVILAVLGGGLWEWLRLCNPAAARFAPVAAVLLSAGLWALWKFAPPDVHWAVMALAGLLWLGYGLPALRRGLPPADARYPVALAAFGVLALTGCYVAALTAFRARGGIFLLSLMAIVWVADIAAYFVGKTLGRHKLAPRISPGKTWEGAAGGMAGVLLYGMLCIFLWGPATYAGALHVQHGLAVAVFALVVLAVLSVCGDLFESMLKRRAGMKDSSQLLPGHGGVLDRIDALLPVLPIALWIAR
jgi:phosphatidate cytidylyltransferase